MIEDGMIKGSSRHEIQPASVWDDPDYLEQLERDAEVEEVLDRYENNQEAG